MAAKRIYIDGPIIPDSWAWYGEDFTSLKGVRDQLAILDAEGAYDELEVAIFSEGGFCSEGWAIHDYLLTLGKKLTGIAYGQCASIATIIFQACQTRKITPNTDFMVHLPWGGIEGNEFAILGYYNEMVIEGAKIVDKYFAKTAGKAGDKVEIKQSLTYDNHMTGTQAVEKGYADELMGEEAKAMQARASAKGRGIRPAIAWLRKPENMPEKTAGKPIPLIPEEQPQIVNNQNQIMAKAKSALQVAETEAQKLLRGIKNLTKGKPYMNLDVNVEGGQILEIDVQGDAPAAGDACTIAGAQAPAGSYTATEDATVYVVGDDGKLVSVTSASAQDEGDDAAATDSAKDEEIAQLKAEIAQLKAQGAQHLKALEQSAKLLGSSISKPVPTTAQESPNTKRPQAAKVAVVAESVSGETVEEFDADDMASIDNALQSESAITRKRAKAAKVALLNKK